jgi:G3E family GTPase
MPVSQRKVPVTVLTGFLGSGKTTLLNQILTKNHGKRIAVIENEYGEIGVDQDLVIHADEEIFEMNNGCICCTVRGDLIRILGNLLKRKQQFDLILIETTGLADPGPVAQTFLTDEEIKAQTQLDSIITLVDCKHVLLHWQSHEVQEQLAFADVVLLNKIDLVQPEEVDQLERKIRSMNAVAKILRCTRGQVDLDQLLDIGAFRIDRVLEHEPDLLSLGQAHQHDCADEHCNLPDHDHNHEHQHHNHDAGEDCQDDHCDYPDHQHDHVHDSSISSVGLVVEGELNPKRVNEWFGNLLQTRGEDLFRMKGILSLKGDPKKFVFQGVHMQFEGESLGAWGTQPRVSKLVFIGRNLDREFLQSGIESCRA